MFLRIGDHFMAKRSLNLYLDEEVISRAERFSSSHQTSISKLVHDFLSQLPPSERAEEEDWTPAVRRLVGAARGAVGVSEYHKYLEEKYGS
jgi:hypothetical protein